MSRLLIQIESGPVLWLEPVGAVWPPSNPICLQTNMSASKVLTENSAQAVLTSPVGPGFGQEGVGCPGPKPHQAPLLRSVHDCTPSIQAPVPFNLNAANEITQNID